MAHESFEDDGVASAVNDRFVVVNVDREERPDVDAVYMTATTELTGQGGWPMTCFLTPDREALCCGTYYPREHILALLALLPLAACSGGDEPMTARDQQSADHGGHH